MAVKLGDDAILLASATPITATAGIGAAVTSATIQITQLPGATVNLSRDSYGRPIRGAKFNYSATGKIDGTIAFDMYWTPGDTGFDLLHDAYKTNVEVFIVALDGPKATSGSWGPAGNYKVHSFNKSENGSEDQKVSVELKPFSFCDFHEVSGS